MNKKQKPDSILLPPNFQELARAFLSIQRQYLDTSAGFLMAHPDADQSAQYNLSEDGKFLVKLQRNE